MTGKSGRLNRPFVPSVATTVATDAYGKTTTALCQVGTRSTKSLIARKNWPIAVTL